MWIATARRAAVPLAVTAAVAGLLLVAVAARSSPSHPFVAIEQTAAPQVRSVTAALLTGSASAGLSSPAPAGQEQAATWLDAAILVFAVLVVIAVLATVLRVRIRPARHAGGGDRRTGGRVIDSYDVPPAELTAGIDAGFDALERGPASDAIIACWLHLEASATEVGLTKLPAETSAEFADRVLGSYRVRPEPLRRLAALYREARFSSHPTPEQAREAARECLEAIRDDLGGTRAQR